MYVKMTNNNANVRFASAKNINRSELYAKQCVTFDLHCV